VIVVEDACRAIDVAGSLAATRQAFAQLAIPCVAAQTII
jgi:nicotinamidase-related amidase